MATDGSLLADLLGLGCIPVVASIGVARDGTLLNVNADTIAAHLAALLGAARLMIAGATAGVLDARGTADPCAVARRHRPDDRIRRRALGDGGEAGRLPRGYRRRRGAKWRSWQAAASSDYERRQER